MPKTQLTKRRDGWTPKEGQSEAECHFEGALFYDTCDPEYLEHSDPEDALAAWLEDLRFEAEPLQALHENGGVTIYAYHPKTVSPDQQETWAFIAADLVHSEFHDELGDPDSCSGVLDPQFKQDILEVVRKHTADWKVWACDEIASQHWSVQEVLDFADANNFGDMFNLPADEKNGD